LLFSGKTNNLNVFGSNKTKNKTKQKQNKTKTKQDSQTRLLFSMPEVGEH
jgi:hypothetical protein